MLLETLSELVGEAAVDVNAAKLRGYSHDSWPVAVKWDQLGKHPYQPEAVVTATSEQQVCDLLAWASRAGVPVTPRGYGSSVTGAPLPLRGGVMLDLSRLTGPTELDETNLEVTVRAGSLGLDLERELQDRGYTLGHSPQSLGRSSVGGWLATRATGQFSSKYGGIEDLIVGFTVALANGELVRSQRRPRASLGPDLQGLFLGAEGTLGVVTSVTLKVFPVPEHRILEAFWIPSVNAGIAAMRQIMRAGLRPFLVRFYDEDETRHVMNGEGSPGCALFLGLEGARRVAVAEHAEARAIIEGHGGRSAGPGPVDHWIHRRFDFSTVEDLLRSPGGCAETIEVAHHWSEIERMYDALKAQLTPVADEVLGHFSHVYPQGTSLYLILLGRVSDDKAAEEWLADVWRTSMQVCLRHGGELSHHHGPGLSRQPYLEAALDGTSSLLRRIKGELDPSGILNPGKLIFS